MIWGISIGLDSYFDGLRDYSLVILWLCDTIKGISKLLLVWPTEERHIFCTSKKDSAQGLLSVGYQVE